MDFGDARRILRGLELPRDGFEDVLAKLGTLKAAAPAVQPRSPNRTPSKTAKAKGSRAA